MAFNILCKFFQLLNIRKIETNCLHYSIQQIQQSKNITPILLQDKKCLPKLPRNDIAFKPKCINLQFNIEENRICKTSKIIECPTILNFIINDPLIDNIEQFKIEPNKVIEIPMYNNIIEKQAARLVIIRRKKMKKHKRKKFLKKMKTVLQKRQIRKKQLRENRFDAELKAMSLKAHNFDPKIYVEERIELLTRHIVPNKWRGEVLSEDIIRKFIEEKKQKKEYKRKLATYRLKIK